MKQCRSGFNWVPERCQPVLPRRRARKRARAARPWRRRPDIVGQSLCEVLPLETDSMPPSYNNRPPVCLNVAEKPSVARALAGVFARLDGAQDRGMRQDAHQVFTHENVRFPSVFQQGHGQLVNGPSEYAFLLLSCGSCVHY